MQLTIWSIEGTKNVVNLCIKYNVPRLIYTSCASVTLRPYLGQAPFAVVVNQTESKIQPSLTGKSLIIAGYSQTKLRAEMIVLGAHGTNLSNGTGSNASFVIPLSCSAAPERTNLELGRIGRLLVTLDSLFRRADNDIDPPDCDVRRGGPPVLPRTRPMVQQVRRVHAEVLRSRWQAPNHICWYVLRRRPLQIRTE